MSYDLNPTVNLNSLTTRQTKSSRFSHYAGGQEDLVSFVHANWDQRELINDEGTQMSIPVNPEGFFSPVVNLTNGDTLVGEFKSRQDGETPRKYTTGRKYTMKSRAAAVDLILYRSDVLLKTGDLTSETSDWEIVSINARTTMDPEPITPETLMYTYFGFDGGTDHGYTESEFVTKLKTSFSYWTDKTFITPTSS